MFENIKFESNQKYFDKYLYLKGEYLHKQIYEVLKGDIKQVLYSDLSSIIRYDKNLRDKLYIYLSTFEEFLRSEIFRKYDVKSSDFVYRNVKGLKQLLSDVFEKTNHDYSNLYYCYELDLGLTISFIEQTKFYDDNVIKDLFIIRNLRNRVLQHNLLVFSNKRTMKEVMKNKKTLKDEIKVLYNILPNDYKKGLIADINSLKCDIDYFRIIIEG